MRKSLVQREKIVGDKKIVVQFGGKSRKSQREEKCHKMWGKIS